MNRDPFSSSDKVVLGSSVGLIALGFTALGSDLGRIITIRLFVIVSILFFAVCLGLTTWWQPRRTIRGKLAERLAHETREKFVKRIASVHEDVHMPLNRHAINTKMKELAKGAANESDFNFKVEHTTFTIPKVEKSFSDTTESMLIHMQAEMQENYRRAYSKPLPEPAGRVKLVVDLAASKLRYYLYAMGIVSLSIAAILFVGVAPK